MSIMHKQGNSITFKNFYHKYYKLFLAFNSLITLLKRSKSDISIIG